MSALKAILPRLDAIKALAEKATPASAGITVTRYHHGGGRMCVEGSREDGTGRILVADLYDEGNREFFAACPEVVPKMRDALEEARELLTHCERLFREHDDTPKQSGEFAECGREHPGIRERLREALG